MKKYLRIELLEDDRQVYAAMEDMRLGILSEKNLLELEDNKNLPSGVSIGQSMVDNFVKETHITTIGDKTTMVRAILKNGFELVETSGCVDKANYNEKIGAEICIEKIKDKIWFLLGFLLQSAVEGIK